MYVHQYVKKYVWLFKDTFWFCLYTKTVFFCLLPQGNTVQLDHFFFGQYAKLGRCDRMQN